jgi:demethylmenaquinone methyltransferase/2-methoxy-6-polyprenyl-1,4-benzoquinol methylase
MTDIFSKQDSSTHFGYAEVPLSQKQHLVDDVFHKVAQRYDVMNDLMSAGLHRLWKDILVSKVNARRQSGFRHLDVAGGTGDVAFRIAKQASVDAEVIVLDINGDMLEVGRDRAR